MTRFKLKDIPEYAKDSICTQLSRQGPHMESNTVNAAARKNAVEKTDARYRIHVHSKRKKLADPDGICAKWIIDGIIKGGVLPDDSTEYIQEVTFSQEKSKDEMTIVTVEEV